MIVVGISDMMISDNSSEVLVTYSLSSCIGLTVYDPVLSQGGMVHCMLPLSRIDPNKAKVNPCMFTDTGVTALIQGMFDRGSRRKDIIVKVAGAATLLDEKGLFRIGERNYTVLRKILWKNNILIHSEHIGGNVPRTMSLYLKDGKTTVKSGGRETQI